MSEVDVVSALLFSRASGRTPQGSFPHCLVDHAPLTNRKVVGRSPDVVAECRDYAVHDSMRPVPATSSTDVSTSPMSRSCLSEAAWELVDRKGGELLWFRRPSLCTSRTGPAS